MPEDLGDSRIIPIKSGCKTRIHESYPVWSDQGHPKSIWCVHLKNDSLLFHSHKKGGQGGKPTGSDWFHGHKVLEVHTSYSTSTLYGNVAYVPPSIHLILISVLRAWCYVSCFRDGQSQYVWILNEHVYQFPINIIMNASMTSSLAHVVIIIKHHVM